MLLLTVVNVGRKKRTSDNFFAFIHSFIHNKQLAMYVCVTVYMNICTHTLACTALFVLLLRFYVAHYLQRHVYVCVCGLKRFNFNLK